MNTVDRQVHLIECSVRLLLQAESLLERIDDTVYSTVVPKIAPHRVGGHMRHILEFYECFLDGVGSGRIDYDSRKRDLAVETERGAALEKTRLVIRRLETSALLHIDPPLLVRIEDAPASLGAAAFLSSSAARELQVLNSHTVHHFALIALTLQAQGVPVDSNFGMAPSTLRYLESKREATLCAR